MAGLPPRDRADARAGALGRVHHDADQRPQGVRHRDLDRTRVDAVRCCGDRGADVAAELRRRERLRPGLGARRVPLPARDPRAAPERAALPEGGLMATYEADAGPIVITDPNERTAAKISRAVAKAPLHLFLAFVALLWLMPTLGLFFTSLLSPTDYISNGWWKVISKPSLATWANYSNVWNTTDIPTSLRITAEIAIGGTLLPIVVAALAGYAFAWVEFPGRDWLF